MTVLKVTGQKANKLFKREAGGHRWQRVPPNEKSGRVHSSTITVAVLGLEKDTTVELNLDDCDFYYYRGSGPGGQHRNKTDSAVRVVHRPTGLVVCNEAGRSQHANKAAAPEVLQTRLNEAAANAHATARSDRRKEQIGSGERSDKIRTVQMKNDIVMDHLTGKKMSASKYLRGHLFE